MSKVSIILPVYNVENYLDRCMNSIINQTFTNIEIIAINDGSTDGSLKILKKYSSKDKRISIIDKKNTGVSDCRNIGIYKCSGDYIIFVDSDDWIDINMVEKMLNEAQKNNSDVVMCSYISEFKNNSKEKEINTDGKLIYEQNDLRDLHRRLVGPINSELSKPQSLDSLGTVWGKLYKSSLIKKNNYKFISLKEIGSAEDTLFNIYVFKDINRLSFIDKPYYHYWKNNNNSITTQYNPNLIYQWTNLFYYMKEFIDINKLGEDFLQALNNRISTCVLGLGLNECSKSNKLSTLKKINNIKNILNNEIIENSYNDFDPSNFPIHWRLFYRFNKNKMAFLSFCMLNTIQILRRIV